MLSLCAPEVARHTAPEPAASGNGGTLTPAAGRQNVTKVWNAVIKSGSSNPSWGP